MKTMFIAATLVAAAVAHKEARAANSPVQPRILPVGTKVSGTAGKPGSIDLYSFMTLPGDTHSITVRSDSKKPVQVQLLDPGGNAILQASGVGEVSVEAIASWADAYSVAVIRSEPAVRYSIDRQTSAGTLQQFVMAHMAGYRRTEGLLTTSCWIEPGKAIRVDYDTSVSERRIQGPRSLERHIQKNGGQGSSSVRTMTIEGDVIAVSEEEAGEVYKTTLDLKPERMRYDPIYKFSGYLCDS